MPGVKNLVRPDDITPEMMERVDEIIRDGRGRPGSLIPVLRRAQEVCGYLPHFLQNHVARGLGIPGSTVFGVVSFYSFFTTTPRGRHTIRICLGTACFVRGSGEALKTVQRELKVDVGGVTDDRRFSLEAVRCLGACGLAPVTVIDEDAHRDLTSNRIMEVVYSYE